MFKLLFSGCVVVGSAIAQAQTGYLDQQAMANVAVRWQQNAIFAECGVLAQPAVTSSLQNAFTVEAAFVAKDGSGCHVRDIFAYQDIQVSLLGKVLKAKSNSLIACERTPGSGQYIRIGCSETDAAQDSQLAHKPRLKRAL